ncbi:hypothetical protein [Schnuerera sp.]|uniref:hypothetical protein n=1 Tax=Schnuerera sp. TaxID=2794844 RepID=UPI002D8040CF|nr:hypothetical protein [Schnuerera sp.]
MKSLSKIMNAPSYNPKMDEMPVFISYPRSGSHWLNCLMELYFDAPRLRRSVTFLQGESLNKKPLWFHDHDIFSILELKHDDVLYLYRNPVDVIFSHLKSEYNGKINEEFIDKEIKLLINHFNKYLLSNKAKVIVKYEKLKSNDYNEFQKIIDWLTPGYDLNINKLDKINSIVKKSNIINKANNKQFLNKKLLSDEYKYERDKFKNKYSDKINAKIISSKLEEFF